MARGRRNDKAKSNGATLGFEATLWAAVDKLRNNMEISECKSIISCLVFTKPIKEKRNQFNVDFLSATNNIRSMAVLA